MKTQEKLSIEGMTCNHCVMRVTKALQSVEGVQSAHVDLNSKSAVVELDGEKTAVGKLIEAVKSAGYQASQ
ncbi:MAG: heavy-metal-associated domain-containing protein [Spirochaetia bacterium]|nr:heavy-metal-associated domain-containing protein [Spirochaetia bacterium]